MFIAYDPGNNFLMPWYKIEYLTDKAIKKPYQCDEPVDNMVDSSSHVIISQI